MESEGACFRLGVELRLMAPHPYFACGCQVHVIICEGCVACPDLLQAWWPEAEHFVICVHAAITTPFMQVGPPCCLRSPRRRCRPGLQDPHAFAQHPCSAAARAPLDQFA
jgi:hypothetical protein